MLAAKGGATPRHVAIVAYGPSMHQYVELAKAMGGRRAFADETWGINAVASVLDCDRAFHMDDVRIQEVRAAAEPGSNIAQMLAWLRTARGPIYTSRAHKRYPGLVDFPLADVLNATGCMPYFNSTPAYALGLCEAIGVEAVSLFGLDYTYANAHHAEKGRACIEFWCGRLHAKGVDIRVSDRSSLLDSCETGTLYGYGRFGSVDPILTRAAEGGPVAVTFKRRRALPSAAEIEHAYDHSRHPSPLVGGQKKD